MGEGTLITEGLNIAKIAQILDAAFDRFVNALDVAIQDQTTTPIDFYFVNIQATPTELLNNIVGVTPTDFVYTFDVVESAGMTVGDYIGIFYDSDAERFFFAEIVTISDATGNATITVETPLDYNFLAGSTVAIFERNINDDGSGTPVVYQVEVGPASDEQIDINRLLFQMKTDGAPTLGTFGDIARLTKGIVLRTVKLDSEGEPVIQNILNIKDNAQLSLHAYDLSFYTALGQGQNGLGTRMTWNGQDKRGVAIRLEPGEKLQIVIQDDLTDITEFFLMAEGHFVNQ